MKKWSKNLPSDVGPHFTMIMFSGTYTRRLRIPPDFVEHISTEAYKFTTLEDSSGSHWSVKLSKTEGDTYLEDGWQDFVKDHSIYDNNVLFFGYDGNTCFNVTIFDESACKRDYVFSTKTNQESAFSDGAKKCDKSSKTPIDSVRKSRKNDPDQCLQTFKPNEIKKVKIELTPGSPSQTILSLSRRRPATEEEKAKVWKKAKSFTPKLPYFLRRLTAANVYQGFTLYIDCNFVRTHLTQQNAKVTLWNTKGQAWAVNMVYNRRATNLCGGWPAFVHANKLEEDDICIFELLDKFEMVDEFEMQVYIFRAVKEVKFATEEHM